MGKLAIVNPMSGYENGEELDSEIFDVDSMTAEERVKAGAKIGRIISARKIKRIDLAAAANVDRKTLRTLETGERAAHPDILKRVIEALGLPQKGDFDLRYSDRTRAFMASVAPIFDKLPDAAKDEAQNDVVVLLTGKLARASQNNAIISNLADRRRANVSGVSDTEEIPENVEELLAGQYAAHKKGDEPIDHGTP